MFRTAPSRGRGWRGRGRGLHTCAQSNVHNVRLRNRYNSYLRPQIPIFQRPGREFKRVNTSFGVFSDFQKINPKSQMGEEGGIPI